MRLRGGKRELAQGNAMAVGLRNDYGPAIELSWRILVVA